MNPAASDGVSARGARRNATPTGGIRARTGRYDGARLAKHAPASIRSRRMSEM
jgi:hypothetical protein